MYIHLNIRYLRVKNNLTQKQLGDQLSVNAGQISNYEKGESDPPLKKIKEMVKLFGVTYNEIIDQDLSKKENSKLEEPSTDYGQKKVMDYMTDEIRRYQKIIRKKLPDVADKMGLND
ncbi:MAG: helix-turn-helix transcriptional regulator [Bacteroidota bacterium]